MVNPSSEETHTQVYEGLVEVEHPASGAVVALKAGQMNSADKIQVGEAREWDGETTWPTPAEPSMPGPEWTRLETRNTGLVHGFASRRHPTLPAPTLAIRRATATE